MTTSSNWVAAAAALIEASDFNAEVEDAELAIALEFSFSTVCFVKYGEENP